MQKFDQSRLIWLSTETERLALKADKLTEAPEPFVPDDERISEANLLEGYQPFLESAGFRMSSAQVNRIKLACRNGKPLQAVLLAMMVRQLGERLGDESNLLCFLVLGPKEADYFYPVAPLFGPDFVDKFPVEGVFELDEAAKCLALGRPTAAVFHLMRTLEIGIRAMARCLGIPDPVKPAQRNWVRILETIKDTGIDVKWPNSADRMTGDGALFESLYVSLDAIRNPWRNATMHVENTYSTEEAEHIFLAAKGFMKKLASRCNEMGEPPA